MIFEPLQGKGRRALVLSEGPRFCMWEGAVRSSKTVGSLFRWLRYCLDGPPGPLLVAGKTERTIDRNVLEPIRSMIGRDAVRYRAGEVEMLGRRVYLVGAPNEAAKDRISGHTLAGAYVDEATLLPESFFKMLSSRCSIDGAQIFATMNPDNPRHWIRRQYLDRALVHLDGAGKIHDAADPEPLDLVRFSFRLDDNPHLAPAYVAQLHREYAGMWRLRYIDGEWVAAEGAVYDSFDPEGRIILKRLPPAGYGRFWIAVDYGTVNAFVALLLGEAADGRIHVISEYRWDSAREGKAKAPSEYTAAMEAWLRGVAARLHIGRIDYSRLWVDPSAQGFIAQLRVEGWPFVRNANNDVADGIRDVATLIAVDGLRIHASCDALIEEMSGYAWDDKKAERGEDAPVKRDDHGPDALRYGVRGTRNVWRRWVEAQPVAA